MAITLTSDPIMTLDDAMALIDESNPVRATFLLNSVSALFRSFTNRCNILKTTGIVEYLIGNGDARLWVHATPIDTTATVQVETIANGTTYETLTLAGGTLAVMAEVGAISRNAGFWPISDDHHNLKVTYTGGWTAGALPADVVMGAVQQMRYERMRFDGKVGVESVSRSGESVSFETGGLLKATRNLWEPWRVLA